MSAFDPKRTLDAGFDNPKDPRQIAAYCALPERLRPKPATPKPRIIIAQVDASGTAAIRRTCPVPAEALKFET
jgi:hypothetical protein